MSVLNDNYGARPPKAYKAASLAAEGRVAPGTDLVRVYSSNRGNMERSWTMQRRDVQGLTPSEIKDKWALPEVPDLICDVEATGLRSRVGIAGENAFGQGGKIQVELLERGAKFTNPRPIGPGGAL